MTQQSRSRRSLSRFISGFRSRSTTAMDELDDREFSSPVCYLKEEDFFSTSVKAESGGLCGRCREFLESADWEGTEESGIQTSSKTSYDNLKCALSESCSLCLVLLEATPMSDRTLLYQKLRSKATAGEAGKITVEYQRIYQTIYQTIRRPAYAVRILLCLEGFGVDIDKYFARDVHVIPADELDPYLSDEKPTGCSTSSEISIQAASEWMTGCSTKHNCHKLSEFLPTRLIDVGVAPSPRPRLVLSSKILPGAQYLTLSHCWGEQIPSKLLRKTLPSMLNSIPVQELSQTFKDALTVTRNLNQRYLWIDALCIIQDDLVDWQVESSRMSEIYFRSLCNICATAATDGSHGLFQNLQLTTVKSLKVFLTLGKIPKSPYYFFDDETWNRDIEKAPLNLRAWVCQERMLSPCNLHFGRNQLFWECRESVASELFPSGVPEDRYRGAKTKQWISHGLFDQSIGRATKRDLWTPLLQHYTSSKLTYAEDKLVALSGLAKLFAQNMGDSYVAGLWEKNLISELLWYIQVPRDDHKFVERKYVAPSWSWASVDGEVTEYVYGMDDDAMADSVKGIVTLAGHDPYGALNGGHLSLSGQLAFAKYNERKFEDIPGELIVWTSCIDSFRITRERRESNFKWDITPYTFLKLLLSEEMQSSGDALSDMYLLPLLLRAKPYVEPRQDYVRGLLLKRTTHEVGVFRRLGTFSAKKTPIADACRYFRDRAEDMGLECTDYGAAQLKWNITIV